MAPVLRNRDLNIESLISAGDDPITLPFGLVGPNMKSFKVCLDRVNEQEKVKYSPSRQETSETSHRIHVKIPEKILKIFIILTSVVVILSSFYFKDKLQAIISEKSIEIWDFTFEEPWAAAANNDIFDSRKLDAVIEKMRRNRKKRREKFEVRNYIRQNWNDFKETGHEDIPGKSFIEQQCMVHMGTPQLADKKLYAHGSKYLKLLNANKFTDYALKSAGAEVLSTQNTEPYGENIITLQPFGYALGEISNYFFPLYDDSRGPTSVIEPWTQPGECWAFKGTRGRIQIKLSDRITVMAVTLEHIPPSLSPEINIDSAPKYFSILGIEEFQPPIKRHLGTFMYDDTGPHIQTFTVTAEDAVYPYQVIEMVILSNHGNKHYTCVYKLRVHGIVR